jgi:uncharacterized glyoxalase superfamily protein PhnB
MRTNRSALPPTVVPVLVYPDVRAAVAFPSAAFGFVERTRIGENHRAQPAGGEGGALIGVDVGAGRRPPQAGGFADLVRVRVGDVEAAFTCACERGATVLEAPSTGSSANGNARLRTVAGIYGISQRRW